MQNRDRAYRRAQRRRIIDNRVNFLRETGQHALLEARDEGRMADRHPMDCGHRCYMCHGDKLLDNGARRAGQEREWQRHEWVGEGNGFHEWAVTDHEWAVLRSDDEMDGLPSNIGEAWNDGEVFLLDEMDGLPSAEIR